MRPRGSGTLVNKGTESTKQWFPVLRRNRHGTIDFRVGFGVVVFLWLASLAANVSPMKVLRAGLHSASSSMAEMARPNTSRYEHQMVFTPKPIYYQAPIQNRQSPYNSNGFQNRSNGGYLSDSQTHQR